VTTVLHARPRGFVSTPAIERIIIRALRYLQSGFPVHLRGPAGTGKTTLALHLADLLSRPIMLLFGDDEFKSTDLIGNQSGYTRKKVVDNFIHSVVKVEDELRHNWVDSRLTLACREGFTLVYDEFNRSRPEVNNVLLSALEEKLLVLPPNSNRNEYIRVNPHFRAIFTSNPEEYCGVHATQDALLDRLITINVPEPDELTQQEIIAQKIGIDRLDAATIVQVVKRFRQKAQMENSSGLRSCLMISKICHEHGIEAGTENAEFRDLCQDILLSRLGLPLREATQLIWETFNELVGADLVSQAESELLQTASTLPMPLPSQGAIAPLSLAPQDSNRAKHEAGQARLGANAQVDTDQPGSEEAWDEASEQPQPQAPQPQEDSAAPRAKALTLTDLTHPEHLDVTLTEAVAITPTPPALLPELDLEHFVEVPFERDVYAYLQSSQQARPSEIETALGINRFQAINALRSLAEKGLIFAQTDADKPSTYAVTPAHPTGGLATASIN
jgi:gas vesicle protein GvpN